MLEVVVAKAPLRISFSGGGSDTPEFAAQHMGHVLSMTITRYATVWGCYVSMDNNPIPASAPTDLSYPSFELDGEFSTQMRLLDEDMSGDRTHLLLMDTYCDVPARSGLGASGALGVAGLTCLDALRGGLLRTLDRKAVALEAVKLERDRMRVYGGQQDQYAAAFGGLNLMTFEGEKVEVEPVTIPPNTMLQLQSSLLLVFIHSRTGSSHQAMGWEVMQVEKGNRAVIEALEEQAAIPEVMVKALKAGDMEAFGLELSRAWEVKKRQSPSVTNDVVDAVYNLARKAGAAGGKLVGAGGGGYMLLFAPGKVGPVVDAMIAVGLRPEPVVFEPEGVKVWHEHR